MYRQDESPTRQGKVAEKVDEKQDEVGHARRARYILVVSGKKRMKPSFNLKPRNFEGFPKLIDCLCCNFVIIPSSVTERKKPPNTRD